MLPGAVRHGLVLFTSDRGITPAATAQAAESAGFDPRYVPEHTRIPVKRTAAHPRTGNAGLPDDRYLHTLDLWVALATAASVTTRIRLARAVALPVEGYPITLARAIATLDHLSGGRVTLGVGFGWNTDEPADHGVPAGKRRAVPGEHLDAMRALWTDEVASHSGRHVAFGRNRCRSGFPCSWGRPVPSAPSAGSRTRPTAGSPLRPKWT